MGEESGKRTPIEVGIKQINSFPNVHPKWHSNQEIASILISAQSRPEWIRAEVAIRPPSGTQVIYRKKDGFASAHYKLDGFIWKKRKEGSLMGTVREDHMKLKVEHFVKKHILVLWKEYHMKLKVKGVELIYANYAHSSLVATFHRRCYWLLSNPDLVFCHYLNVTPQKKASDFPARDCLLQSLKAHSNLSKFDILEQLKPILALETNLAADKDNWLNNLVDGVKDASAFIIINQATPQQLLISMESTHLSSKTIPITPLTRQPSSFSDEGVLGRDTSRSSDSACCSLGEENPPPTFCQSTVAISETTVPPNTNIPPAVSITEYSPDWAYANSHVKVLISGPWYSCTQTYSCMFDKSIVDALLVQSGVLRCFCPAHGIGSVALRVLCGGNVISNAVLFEFRENTQIKQITANTSIWDSNGGNDQLILGVLERLEYLEKRLQTSKMGDKCKDSELKSTGVEDRLCMVVEGMSDLDWMDSPQTPHNPPPHGLTLLHLVSALGFSKLLCSLFRWRAEKPSAELEQETSTRKLDIRGRCGLFIACAYGHVQCVKLLVSSDKYSIDIQDINGKSPIDIAFINGRRDVLDILMEHKQDLDDCEPAACSAHDSTALWVLTGGMTAGAPSASTHPMSFKRCRRQSNNDNVQSSVLNEYDDERYEKRRHHLSVEGIESLLKNAAGTESPLRHASCSGIDDTFSDLDEEDWVESVFNPNLPLQLQVPDSPRTQQMMGRLSGAAGREEARTHMLGLAEQFIAAMPDRIKRQTNPSVNIDVSDPLLAAAFTSHSPTPMQQLENNNFFNFRVDCGLCDTPSCSTSAPSPASSCLQSHTTDIFGDNDNIGGEMDNLGDFFNPAKSRCFSDLTLTDQEQRELYEAARVIQTAYRQYKAKMRNDINQPTDAERQAATVIQSYYRRYKQFCYFKKIHRAAMLIQKHFRTYKATKRRQGGNRRLDTDDSGARCKRDVAAIRIQHAYRGHYMRKRHVAATKIQKFMRESRQKLRKARKTGEKGVANDHENTLMQDSQIGLCNNLKF